MKLFPNFTRHHFITHTNFSIFFSPLGLYPDFFSTFSSTFEVTESMLRFQLTEVGITVVKALYRRNFGDAKRKAL